MLDANARIAELARMDGKLALVTGASSGLGRRFAELLAALGATVAVAARRADKLNELVARIESHGGKAVTVEMDVQSVPAIRGAVQSLIDRHGPVEILVNNAGMLVQNSILNFEEADYDALMDVNTKGAFFVAQSVARAMVEHKTEGRIINVASTAALRVQGKLSVYGMSKDAVVYMTRAMALEWGRHNINVNAICPGYISTELTADYFASDMGKKRIAQLPRSRVGEVDDMDAALLFLAGNGARFVNGAVIAVDDGYSVS